MSGETLFMNRVSSRISSGSSLKFAMSKDVDLGGCPLAGCLSVGLHGGHPNFTVGLGPAISSPSFTVGPHDPNETSGCSQSNKVFGYVQMGPAFVGGAKTSSQISGPTYGPYEGSFVPGIMIPGAKFNPVSGPKASSGSGAGGGFVHQWSCTSGG